MFSAKAILLLIAGWLLATAAGVAAITGTNVPSQSLTTERLASLPAPDRLSWEQYLAKSTRQSQADRAAFAAELRTLITNTPSAPPTGRGLRGLALNKPTSWYAEPEALRLADIIVSFQTPAGGWSKNLDMTQHRRAPGELYAIGNVSRFATATDLDRPRDPDWNYVGTFDNGATITQLRFLAKVISATDQKPGEVFHASFVRGLEYIFAAQFPNGGWPQVWPLQGGYHDGVTLNDNAMTGILDLLLDVTEAKTDFKFVPAAIRTRARSSLIQGLDCILTTQVSIGGERTAWAQQYDALTLRPSSARNYEMPSLSSGESAGIMLFLMRLPNPNPNVIAAVHAAARWLERVAIHDHSYQRGGSDGPLLVATPGSGPIWSRYYELETNRPIFGDRDKTIHDTVAEISRERRIGYAWFTDGPQTALKNYARWKQTH